MGKRDKAKRLADKKVKEELERVDQLIDEARDGFTEEELNEALFHVEGLFERMVVNFFVLNETAKGIKQGKLYGNALEVGCLQNQITPESQWTFDKFAEAEKLSKHEYLVVHNRVPISIKFIQNEYDFFKNPDTVMYVGGGYNLPNPFNKYWEMKDEVE